MTTSKLRSPDFAKVEARRLRIRGLVQGIGFRPFVYRLATQLHLCGGIRNTTGGVEITLEGDPTKIEKFQDRLIADLPRAGRIDECLIEAIAADGRSSFVIESSADAGPRHARIAPDRAICDECRRDTFDPRNRRFEYPFTACTLCGPRYSVIETLPYDRETTSLRIFPLCSNCSAEYSSPLDRRFHAQAIVCADCGPQVNLLPTDDSHTSIEGARALLIGGMIVAIKGLGGYQLLVRADDSAAVARLRRRKHRPSKPFAVMVENVESAVRLAVLSATECAVLRSPENPIVLVQRRFHAALSNEVAPNVSDVGLLLPSTPLHELLLRDLGFAVVATSGNRSEEPPAIELIEASERLADIADAFLDHNRPIVRRLDDSVVRIINERAVVFRAGRGYAPVSLRSLEQFDATPMLATGGHLKVALAIHTGTQSLLTEHLGDLDDPLSRVGFDAAARRLQNLFDFKPTAIAADQHPDYFTTRWAQSQGLPVVQVQHHHAHAAAVQVEHSLLHRAAGAVIWDGTGYGTDGTLWGGEFLVTDPRGDFRRVASLRPIPLIGGEAAIRRPARIAFAMLWQIRGSILLDDPHWLSHLGVTRDEAHAWGTMLDRNINVIWSSGVGRLFDGLAALVLGQGQVTYESEAAMLLESVAKPTQTEYPFPFGMINSGHPGDRSIPRGDWRPMLAGVLDDLRRDVEVGIIAGRIHAALAAWIVRMVREFGDLPIVLGGGCFQNRLLSEQTLTMIKGSAFYPRDLPPGDGGLAAGQLAVALQRCIRR